MAGIRRRGHNAQPMGVVTARLVGGPRDGATDRIILPAPELVAFARCEDCRREHLFTATTTDTEPLYLLAMEGPGDPRTGEVVYHWLDPDADVHDALELPYGQPATPRAL